MISAIEILLKGVLLGFTVSMPLGPVSIILINRTIKRGFLSGFFSGLGLAQCRYSAGITGCFGIHRYNRLH